MPSMYNELLVSSFCTWVLPYIHVSCIHAALKGLNQGKIGLNTTWLFLQKESKRYGFHKSQNNSLPNKTAKVVKTTSECLSRFGEFPWNLTKLIDRQNHESHESPWPTSATPMPTKHLILRPHGAQQSLQGDSHDNSAKGCKTNTIQPAKNRQHVLGGGNLQIQWKTISSTNGSVSSSDSFESHMRSSQMSDFQQKLPKIVEVEL